MSYKSCVINDPLGQTHCPTISDHYFQAKFVFFCDILGRTDGKMCENNDHCRPGLRVDQLQQIFLYSFVPGLPTRPCQDETIIRAGLTFSCLTTHGRTFVKVKL